MISLSASELGARLEKIVDDAASSHEPIHINGKNGSAVLVGEDDWRAIQETLYLVSIPGMRDSIRKGMRLPPAKCAKTLKW